MCGSTDLVKKDGLFVCQFCGCKYTLEEARKLMIEGVVEVSGTVKVDTSSQYANTVTLARAAFQDKKYEEAQKHATDALLLVSNDPEMIIIQGLSVLGQQHYTDRLLDITAIENSFKRAIDSINMITEISKKKEIISKIEAYIHSVFPIKINELNRGIKHMDDLDKIFKYGGDTSFVSAEYRNEDMRKVHRMGCSMQKERYEGLLISCDKTIEEMKKELLVLEARKNKETIEDYLINNPEERVTYNQKVQELETRKKMLEAGLTEKEREIIQAENDRENHLTPLQIKRKELNDQISELEKQRKQLGFFKRKEIKAMDEKITEVKSQLPNDYDVNKEIEEYSSSAISIITALKREANELRTSISDIEQALGNIKSELLKKASA